MGGLVPLFYMYLFHRQQLKRIISPTLFWSFSLVRPLQSRAKGLPSFVCTDRYCHCLQYRPKSCQNFAKRNSCKRRNANHVFSFWVNNFSVVTRRKSSCQVIGDCGHKNCIRHAAGRRLSSNEFHIFDARSSPFGGPLSNLGSAAQQRNQMNGDQYNQDQTQDRIQARHTFDQVHTQACAREKNTSALGPRRDRNMHRLDSFSVWPSQHSRTAVETRMLCLLLCVATTGVELAEGGAQ